MVVFFWNSMVRVRHWLPHSAWNQNLTKYKIMLNNNYGLIWFYILLDCDSRPNEKQWAMQKNHRFTKIKTPSSYKEPPATVLRGIIKQSGNFKLSSWAQLGIIYRYVARISYHYHSFHTITLPTDTRTHWPLTETSPETDLRINSLQLLLLSGFDVFSSNHSRTVWFLLSSWIPSSVKTFSSHISQYICSKQLAIKCCRIV